MFEEFNLNQESTTPRYLQIYNYIKMRIYSGHLPIGTKLPTQKELANQFGVNRSTIVSACEMLMADDLVESNGKAGTFVKNNGFSLNAPAPPNWDSYIQAGSHYPNKNTVQLINNNEHRKDIYVLTRPELSNELFMPEMLDAIRQYQILDPDLLGYENPYGNLELRENICAYYADAGISISPDQVLIVSGALQALYLISAGILYKGSAVLTEDPSYIYSVNVFQSAGMRLFGIPTDDNGIDLSLLEKTHSQTRASLLYSIPNFNNPTGVLMSEDRKRDLYKLCQNRKLPVIEDDTYRELYFTDYKPVPLKAYDTNELVLLVGSCSKVLFPGLRLGWIVGTKPVIDRLADIKTQIDLGTNALSQRLMNYLLSSGYYARHLEFARNGLRRKRDFMLAVLDREFRGLCSWKTPTGGVYIWLELPQKVSAAKLFHRALKNGVLFCPGYMYSNHMQNAIRISFSYLSDAELEQSLLILKRCILEELS